MAEKEEASTGTSSFSRILNLLDVLGRLQWFNNILIVDAVEESNFPESFRGILAYDYISLQVERAVVIKCALLFIEGIFKRTSTSNNLRAARKDIIII